MKKFRIIKLLAGTFVLSLLGAISHSCKPVIKTCYKPAPPDDRDSSGYNTIRNTCYDTIADPLDTTLRQ